MTNKSIALLNGLAEKTISEKESIIKEVVSIEFEKIIAQANILKKKSNVEDRFVKGILATKNSDELFCYLKKLTMVEISLITSYGIDVDFMNIINVSE